MTDADQLWALLADIERLLPLRQEALEQQFRTTFEQARDHNRQLIHVAKTPTFELELRPPSAGVDAMLVVRFAPPLQVGTAAVHEHFPGGHSLPPPPPGWGPPDAAGAYVAERPWGQIWFTFFTGDRLMQLSIGPGMHGSPGV
jgi:hypothetical protein